MLGDVVCVRRSQKIDRLSTAKSERPPAGCSLLVSSSGSPTSRACAVATRCLGVCHTGACASRPSMARRRRSAAKTDCTASAGEPPARVRRARGAREGRVPRARAISRSPRPRARCPPACRLLHTCSPARLPACSLPIQVILDCAESNAPFYKRCGFRRAEVRACLDHWKGALRLRE